MKEKLLRFLFKTNKKFFLDLTLEDLYGQIPKQVSDPGIAVLLEQKSKFDRLFMWQAYVLQRRMVFNPKEGEMLMGMLIQIKMFSHMIAGGVATTEESAGVSSAAKAAEDRKRREEVELESAITGVENFINKSPTKKRE